MNNSCSRQHKKVVVVIAIDIMLSSITLARSLARRSVSSYCLASATTQRVSFFSTDSHDDFAPKRKVVVDSQDEALTMIADHVRENKVMLYMKGNPSAPLSILAITDKPSLSRCAFMGSGTTSL